ncbi:MAG: HAD-IA family hydrolase [Armatimonadetes bacterium]|nr:HAD-IA family hydrolase [Armatimonadota bacterium]
MLTAALFDIDGTLADTTLLIRDAVTQVLRADGIVPTDDEMKKGWTMTALDRMRLWARSEVHAADLTSRYHERYLARHDALVRPYPGVEETLAALAGRGIPMAVVTSKIRTTALRALDALGLQRFFAALICEEDTPVPKPDPAPLLLAAEQIGARPATTLMVGDGAVDILAGRDAGMVTAGAGWGALDPQALRAARPTYLLAQPADLLELFAG